MKELYTLADSTRIGFYKSVLDEAGIVCFIQNDAGAPLNVVSPIFQPTLCVVDDDRYEEAVELLKPHHYQEGVEEAAEWTCAKCKESNPGGFEVCWNCETAREGTSEEA